jgi:hypothetical protein
LEMALKCGKGFYGDSVEIPVISNIKTIII